MRFLILILSLILFVACHNKSDLKKIEELEKENKEMRKKLNPENINSLCENIERRLLDSIIIGNDYTKGCWLSSIFYVVNKTSNHSIKLNNGKYFSDIHFVENRDADFDTIYFSIPSQNRINFDFEEDYKLSNKVEKNFSFTPKDTGWYYFQALVPIKNKRTRVVNNFRITDSFYVYK